MGDQSHNVRKVYRNPPYSIPSEGKVQWYCLSVNSGAALSRVVTVVTCGYFTLEVPLVQLPRACKSETHTRF